MVTISTVTSQSKRICAYVSELPLELWLMIVDNRVDSDFDDLAYTWTVVRRVNKTLKWYVEQRFRKKHSKSIVLQVNAGKPMPTCA